jgi:transcriptional regulator with XRE-family HTH domain
MSTAQDLLKAIRAHGLTQADISSKTGIKQPTISKIERGQVGDVMSKSYIALTSLLAQLDGKANRASKRKQAA